MNNEKTFRTKTGFCHILPDKIVLTRDGIIGKVAKVTVGNNISRILILYGALSLVLLYFAFDSYKNGEIIKSLSLAVLAIIFIYGVMASINNSATPIIERQKIKDVKFKKGTAGLSRSRFEVFFENENGKIKKRLIMLPDSLSEGHNDTDNALQIMMDENLIRRS